MNIAELKNALNTQDIRERIKALYSTDDASEQCARIAGLAERFSHIFPTQTEFGIYSAPGRTEIGGNHTDHQHGCVLAAAVTMDAIAAAAPNGTDTVVIHSEGYEPFSVRLDMLEPAAGEESSPAALVRGMAKGFIDRGYSVGGFSACITSAVPGGSGLSSSACFEVLIGTLFNEMFCGGQVGKVELAGIGQFAENNYAKKPSGLLDQATASVGGLVSMDFSRADDPVLDSISFDFEEHGYVLCVVNTGGSHADLTGDYAAITAEMAAAAQCFGKRLLSEVDEAEFYADIASLRKKVGDRAVLRAMHYMEETKRAPKQAQALRGGDIEHFLALVNESGRSSELCLQNIFSTGAPAAQGVTLGLAAARRVLGGKGAYRVHGGGFAGTVQAYVPKDDYKRFVVTMEGFFGADCCYRLAVRPIGGTRII